jgi:hypothetical protein
MKGRRSDSERVEFLAQLLDGSRWDDTLPEVRPCDNEGYAVEKYINADTFREMIDRAMLKKGTPHHP